MIKTYVLDTNILLFDPNAIFQFQDNHVVIPLSVVKELDKFKKELTEIGRNARTAVRMLDELRAKGSLAKGVKTAHGGIIQVVCEFSSNGHTADDEILELSKKLNKPEKSCIVVTKDVNLRVRCDVQEIAAEDYESGKSEIFSEIYMGQVEIKISQETMDEFRRNKEIGIPNTNLFANQYVLLEVENNPKDKAMTRVSADGTIIKPLIHPPREMASIQPKNKEQHFFMDALLDDKIHLVTVIGRAGSGKTLLSVAAGFHQTIEQKKYMRMLVSRPVFPMGRDIGYLPGTVAEKLDPFMRPIYDAFDFIADNRTDHKHTKEKVDDTSRHKNDGRTLMEKCGKIEIEPLMYIRGRSIHRQFVIVDEAQNLSPLEIKTIITRAGPGTKMVITGDIYQIDNNYLDVLSNGLSYVVGRMKGQSLYAHITLEKGVRSELATKASELL